MSDFECDDARDLDDDEPYSVDWTGFAELDPHDEDYEVAYSLRHD
jgi:hypothetical protein